MSLTWHIDPVHAGETGERDMDNKKRDGKSRRVLDRGEGGGRGGYAGLVTWHQFLKMSKILFASSCYRGHYIN